VIRRHVLAALAAGVDAGDDAAARTSVTHADWILRGPARRTLERALVDAALLTREYGAADAEAMRHVQRVAALTIAGIDVDANDRARVATAYARLERPPAQSPPIATILASSLATLAMIALVWFGASLRHTPRPSRPPAPLAAGAFFYGGAPARDAVLEKFLVDELTSLAIESDADRRGDREGLPRARHVAELRDAPQIASHGPALAAAWRDFIAALDRWSQRPIGTSHLREAAAELGATAKHVSDQFAALGLGYYIQADVLLEHSAHLAVFVYRVDEVVFVRAGGQPRRVLGLRRLDRLNLRYALLGRQGEELGDPVVLLDQIDEFVKDRVMPTLHGAPYSLGDAAWQSSVNGRTLAAAAGEAIRRELTAALAPGCDRTAERCGESTAADDPAGVVTRIVTASVRRHEARHGIDIDREQSLRMPAPLAAYLGRGRDDASRRFAFRTRAELAAYTSQIGNDPVTPQLALWNLASQAFNRERWGSAESYAAVVVIEGLAHELGVAQQRPVVSQGQLDRARLVALAAPLAAQSSDKLRMAARTLWTQLYGEPMLPIVDLLH